jgi:hypothetical protein
MTLRRGALSIAVGLAAALALPVSSLAQPAAPPAETAVSLAAEAKASYDRGAWAEALELFARAEEKAHSPVIVLYMARCHRNLGRLVEARDLYAKVASEELAPGAPEPFVTAKADAAEDLNALEPRVPRITISLVGIPQDAAVEVDGRVLTPEERGERTMLNPGAHTIRALRGGAEVARAEIQLAEGADEVVELRAATQAPLVPIAPEAPTTGGDAQSSSGSLAPGLIVTGIGAVALGAGVVTRILAFQKVEDVKSRCVGGSCLAEDEAEIDSAVTLQTVSTICLVAGGAAVAAGIVLLVVAPGGDDPSVSVRVGPGGVMATGAF